MQVLLKRNTKPPELPTSGTVRKVKAEDLAPKVNKGNGQPFIVFIGHYARQYISCLYVAVKALVLPLVCLCLYKCGICSTNLCSSLRVLLTSFDLDHSTMQRHFHTAVLTAWLFACNNSEVLIP